MPTVEDYLREGPDAWDDAALLSVWLGGPRASERAQALLRAGDGLAGLRRAEPRSWARAGLLTPTQAARLHAGLSLAARAARAAPPRALHDARTAGNLFIERLAGLAVEELHAAYVDRRLRAIAVRTLTRGTDQVTLVDPRQVFRPAAALGAWGVIVAHNHPSGDPTPSAQDRAVTLRLAQAGQVLGVRLIDHLVVADGRAVSLAEAGAVPPVTELPGWIA
jgi:DNA repair protein RadC